LGLVVCPGHSTNASSRSIRRRSVRDGFPTLGTMEQPEQEAHCAKAEAST
jgi:hypothetical protein